MIASRLALPMMIDARPWDRNHLSVNGSRMTQLIVARSASSSCSFLFSFLYASFYTPCRNAPCTSRSLGHIVPPVHSLEKQVNHDFFPREKLSGANERGSSLKRRRRWDGSWSFAGQGPSSYRPDNRYPPPRRHYLMSPFLRLCEVLPVVIVLLVVSSSPSWMNSRWMHDGKKMRSTLRVSCFLEAVTPVSYHLEFVLSLKRVDEASEQMSRTME